MFTKFLRCLCFAPGIPEDTRQREWVLAYPGIEAAHKVIVHEQLADDTKDKEDKGIRSERPVRVSAIG